MPFKTGGGKRMQLYDPSTGRYCCGVSPKTQQPTASEHLKDNKRADIYLQALKSKDPLLFETYLFLEREMPGSIKAINLKIRDHRGIPITELDIVMKRFVIEIKSGNSKHQFNQFLKQHQYVKEELKKEYIIYAPNMRFGVKRALILRGYNAAESLNELKGFIRKGKKK